MTDFAFLSREEVLGGLPAKRANTLLFAIENRTGQLVARARSALTVYASERTVAERERAFLDALSAGREPPTRPTPMDLERYAPDWARLVPPDADLRASLAKLIGARYRLPAALVPRLRTALGIDEPDVQAAYRRLHGAPIETVFVPRVTLLERLRWARARLAERLETLPAFWTAFALTLTETVGAGVLALPIALATLGAPAAALFIVVLGAVNLVTIIALVESITRSGSMRYGVAYFGRLVGDFLGRPGRTLMNVMFAIHAVLALMVLFLGFGSVLGGVTGVPVGVWAAVLLVIVLVVLRGGTLDATLASALVIGIINIALIGAISLAALSRMNTANLAESPLGVGGGDSALLGIAVAVILSSYFGHTSAANAAKHVLRRDPSGRALLAGNTAAMAVAVVLYVVTTVAIIGAIGPEPLSGYRGTSLELLSGQLGPLVGVIGVAYASLAMGLAAIHVALGLGNLVMEQLPDESAAHGRNRGLLARLAGSATGRAVIRLAPTVAVVVFLQWLLLTGIGSFTGLLGLVGALVVPIIGGVFPMLLVIATRRRGELIPGHVVRVVGTPVIAVAVGAVYVAVVAVHALVNPGAPIEAAAALGVVAAVVVSTVLALRGGAMRQRAVVEVAVDEASDDEARFSVVVGGRPAEADVTLDQRGSSRSIKAASARVGRLSDVRSMEFRLPALAGELKLWLHRVTTDGDSVALDASTAVDGNPLLLDGEGQASVPVGERETVLTVRVIRGDSG